MTSLVDPVDILVVDDDHATLRATQLLLADLVDEVVTVPSGREALRLCLARDFAMILMDVRMPEMDGFETASLIRARPRSEATPIVFLTGDDDSRGLRSRGYALGAVDYLLKPVDPTILRSKVAVFVELRRRTLEGNRQATRLAELEARKLRRQLEEAAEAERRQAEQRMREVLEQRDLVLRRANEELDERVRERTAELEVSVAELEAFCSSVSHDLRAPLRAIGGFTRILEEQYHGHLDAEGKDAQRRLDAAVRRMGELIDDLLGLSRVSRVPITRQPVDLARISGEVVSALREREPEREVDVEIDGTMAVEGDPGLLRIMMENLLGNAWKFTRPREHARVQVGSTPGDPPTFFVRDNGVGFDPAHRHRLFQAFHRLHGEQEFEGNGIGLATVSRVVQRHRGTLVAESALGEGATFRFTLAPRAREPDA